MGDSFPFRGRSVRTPWRGGLLLTTALLLGMPGARAQDATSGNVFHPLPEEIPGMLFGGLVAAESPTEIAREIRESIPGAALAPASPDQPLDISSVEPLALIGTGLPDALEASLAPEQPVAAPGTSAVISVIVENVETSGGTINIGLCDKGLSRDTCPYDKEVQAAAGFVEVTFESIPPGNYAVVAYHDLNGNGQFDRFLGLPREPYALSGRAATEMVPSFNDAALPIRTGENAVVIRLKRLVGR
jgi:uncharacterized protein (DUF2141 family)